ncbi:MAG: alanine racemase [Thermodesulfobacteriota bacterium]
MGIGYNLVTARVFPRRIAANWRLLAARGGNAWPVVKADAYGHGLAEAARELVRAGATDLCAGSVGEAAQLLDLAPGARAVSLLGPLDRAECAEAAGRGILSFACRFEQLALLAEAARDAGRPARVALKFDTGMARLGFEAGDLPELLDTLAASPGLVVEMAASHLATADEPAARDFVLEQGRRFDGVVASLRAAGLPVAACLANSAAILAYPGLRLDVQRPGIALYGANPFHGTSLAGAGEGLLPAMEVSAPILQAHDLPAGRSISYGRTFTAPRDMRVAVVAAGYADNYSRGLSNRGFMNLGGVRVPILGRVCMQMTAVDVTGLPAQAGDEVFLLGGPGPGSVAAEDLAAWWGAITYEVFCLLGQNRRVVETQVA